MIFNPPAGNCWRVSKKRFDELNKDKRIWWGEKGDNVPRLKRFLSEVKQGITPQTLLKYEEVGHTQEASQELKELFPELDVTAFPTPKPVRLMQRLLQIATQKDENDIVMDFFAGSCSFAHGVMKQNHEDGGNRRFIIIQLPEPITRPLILNDLILKTISDIGKERLRRVIKKYKADSKLTKEELNFKVFKLQESNFKLWDGTNRYTINDYMKQLENMADSLKWSNEEDILYEVALREGFKPTCYIEKISGLDNTIKKVVDPDVGQFLLCLDSKISANSIKLLNLQSNQTFICRDNALDDSMAANLALQCRLKTL